MVTACLLLVVDRTAPTHALTALTLKPPDAVLTTGAAPSRSTGLRWKQSMDTRTSAPAGPGSAVPAALWLPSSPSSGCASKMPSARTPETPRFLTSRTKASWVPCAERELDMVSELEFRDGAPPPQAETSRTSVFGSSTRSPTTESLLTAWFHTPLASSLVRKVRSVTLIRTIITGLTRAILTALASLETDPTMARSLALGWEKWSDPAEAALRRMRVTVTAPVGRAPVTAAGIRGSRARARALAKKPWSFGGFWELIKFSSSVVFLD